MSSLKLPDDTAVQRRSEAPPAATAGWPASWFTILNRGAARYLWTGQTAEEEGGYTIRALLDAVHNVARGAAIGATDGYWTADE
jgi:hypothetical protein